MVNPFPFAAGVTEPATAKTGRPRLPLRDAVFAVCFKIYSTLSCRRFMSDIWDAHSKGYLSRVPHFNSLCNYLENPELTPILYSLITETSLPLKSVEVDFAADWPLESAKRETGTQDESNSEPSMAMAASLSGATTLTPPRSSRIQPRLAHARSCLLVLSRDIPII